MAAQLSYRYFIKDMDGNEREVTMEEYVQAERMAGFHNTLGRPDLPATAGWSSTTVANDTAVSGRMEYVFPEASDED